MFALLLLPHRYASTRSGHIFEIDYSSVVIKNVRRLLPAQTQHADRREKWTFNTGGSFRWHYLNLCLQFNIWSFTWLTPTWKNKSNDRNVTVFVPSQVQALLSTASVCPHHSAPQALKMASCGSGPLIFLQSSWKLVGAVMRWPNIHL